MGVKYFVEYKCTRKGKQMITISVVNHENKCLYKILANKGADMRRKGHPLWDSSMVRIASK